MAKFDWQRYIFEDVTGQPREIQSCPYTRLDKLKDYLDLLMQVLTNLGALDFKSAYCQSSQVRLLSNSILEVCGISPEWVSIQMAEKLIHHQSEDDGTFKPGILIEINFPQKSGTGKAMDFKEWIANGIASLLSVEGSKSIGEALAIADTIPHDFLESLLLARCHQMNPKSKQLEELEELNNKNPPTQAKDMIDFANIQWQDVNLEKYL